MFAIRVAGHGGADVLAYEEVPTPTPGPGEIAVDVSAVGLNYIDTYQRSGLYPMKLPYTPGSEAAGVVSAVGEGVTEFAIGDRVAWAGVPGAYAEVAVVPTRMAVRVPDAVALDTAAAVMLQGMTAHFLAVDTFPLSPGDRCLVHAAAGGVGLLLVQIAKRRGAEVFATVGSAEKADLARAAGADHVVSYRDADFAAEIQSIAGEARPLDVVYDGVGKAVFERSLDLLRPRGMMVTFGNASGPVDPVLPLKLSQAGSLFLTRPTLTHYIATRDDLERRVGDLFAWIADGSLQVRIGARVPLADAAEAHRMLEGRETTGKVLLLP